AHRLNQELIALQKELVEAVGLAPVELPEVPVDALRQTIYHRYGTALKEAKQIMMKAERNEATRVMQETVVKELVPTEKGSAALVVPAEKGSATLSAAESSGDPAPSPVPADAEATVSRVKAAFAAVEERVVRELILDGTRPDGRGP